MGTGIAEFILDVLALVLDFLTIGKIRKRREANEKSNFQKKKRVPVYFRAYVVVPIVVLCTSILFFSFIKPSQQIRDTNKKLRAISYFLSVEKEHFQKYPEDIVSIALRNPTYGDLTLDSWDNEIIYQKTENGENFILVSKGKDGELHTDDDISMY